MKRALFAHLLLTRLVAFVCGETVVQIRRFLGFRLAFGAGDATQNFRALSSTHCIGMCAVTQTCSAVNYDNSNLNCTLGLASAALEILQADTDFEAIAIRVQ